MTNLEKQPSGPRFRSEAKALLLLSIPIVVSQLAQMGMNFTDTIMAGHHSETSLAGVAIGSSFWVPCFLFLVGILMAVTPMVAQAWGARNTNDIDHTIQQGLWLAIVFGLVMMLVLQLLASIFDAMEMEPQTRIQAKGYVFAVSFGLPALAFFQILRGLNEGLHLTRPFMYTSLIALLINIPLNYIFVYGKFGFPALGGVGCGWATAIVLWIELFLMLFLTLRNRTLNKFAWYSNWRKPERKKIIEILKLGIPIGIALLIESSMFALIALFLAELGSTVVAGHQVAMSFISTLFMIPLSLSLALTIRCGYYIGQGQPQHARYVGFLGLGVTLATATIFSLLILSASENIASLYSTNLIVKALAVELLFLAAIFQFSDAIQVTATGILRGYKDTRFAFFVVLIAYWIVGLPLGYSLALTSFWGKEYGAHGFWIGFIAGLGVASIALAIRFIKISRLQINTEQC